ncbi:hypothetical protein [Chitiniphilus eburneus]|uniref:Transcriptional regulator n=1 Tax=Chitiniphilus eburneus TaxID=2571148 RepID=A0A4U0QBT8_9NEIS|nr:hypothetical protein [Chitiniphilus eburneus]TJZ78756.1 hypothetical protein FAZ21_00235 [Chitiniphilus eburneus]
MRYEMLNHMPELFRALGNIQHGKGQPADAESHMHYCMLQANGLAQRSGGGFILTERGEHLISRREADQARH